MEKARMNSTSTAHQDSKPRGKDQYWQTAGCPRAWGLEEEELMELQ